ncbi:hypothetical protein HC256_008299 [Beauveria bassiana]|nr:hypothetical protein HC256_008299 [Beauveria bassiana]
MDAHYEAIDEFGDLLLILRPRTEPIDWLDEDYDQNQDTAEDTDEDTLEGVEDDELIAEMEGELEDLISEYKIPVRAADIDTAADTDTEPQMLLEQDARSTDQLTGDVLNGDLSGNDSDLETKHRLLVSSHILRLASRVFRKDLDPNGPWRQPEIQPDGLRHKKLDGFDPEALKHVLNLIHFHNDRVPVKLETKELAEVALIVDYFHCHEAMRLAVKNWIGEDRIKEVINNAKPGRELNLWLLIASVFEIDAIINAAANIIIEHNEEPFDSIGLPIAENITSRMDNARETVIQRLLGNIYQFKATLSTDKVVKPNSPCDSVYTLGLRSLFMGFVCLM